MSRTNPKKFYFPIFVLLKFLLYCIMADISNCVDDMERYAVGYIIVVTSDIFVLLK